MNGNSGFTPKSPLRRSILKGIAAVGAAGVLNRFGLRTAEAADKVNMGFIYVGSRDDYGYNQSHYQGKTEVGKLSWVNAFDQENVPETVEVEKVMESMINLDGAQVLFPTSFGYFNPHILKEAKKYPNVTFLHCGGLWKKGMPTNVGSYFGYIDEPVYLSGLVAGLTTKTNKLGFIAAIPIPQVLRNINNFTLAARSVNPKVTTHVVFTGGWFNPVKEAEAANSMVDEGIDVLTCHVDSPKVIIQTAEKRGVYCCGYHTNQAVLAPKGFLTGAEWNWGKVYLDYAEMIRTKKKIPNLVRGGLKEGIVKSSPYGPAVSAKAKRVANKVHKKFMKGTMVVYKGPIKDNTGKTVIPKGKEYHQKDIWLESMNFLVEGVIGTTKS
ncbi:MAG: BMP family ABC transporter substrate-binding protein [Acidiferrobacteraceae bacterium]|jgi:basic membrane protein A